MNATKNIEVGYCEIIDLGEAKPAPIEKGFVETMYSFEIGGLDEFQMRAEHEAAEQRQKRRQRHEAHARRSEWD